MTLLALVVTLVLVWQHAAELERAADRDASLVEFMHGTLAFANTGPFSLDGPRERVGPAIPLGDALQHVAERLLKRTDMDPGVEMQVRHRLGTVLLHAGQWLEGRPHLLEALALAEQTDAQRDERLEIRAALLWCDMLQADVVRASADGRALLDELRELGEVGSERWSYVAVATAWSLLMNNERRSARGLTADIMTATPDDALVARTWARIILAQCDIWEGYQTRGKAHLAAVQADLKRIRGPHLVRAVGTFTYALAAMFRHEPEEQLEHVLASRAEFARMVGPGENDLTDHWLPAHVGALDQTGSTAEAEDRLKARLPRIAARLGRNNPRATQFATILAEILARQGRIEEVMDRFRAWRDGGRTSDVIPGLAASDHAIWASILLDCERDAELANLVDEMRNLLAPWVGNPPTGAGFERDALLTSARLFHRLPGEAAQAAAYANAALAAWRARGETRHLQFLNTLEIAATLQIDLGDHAAAERLHAELRQIYRDSGMHVAARHEAWGGETSPAPASDQQPVDKSR